MINQSQSNSSDSQESGSDISQINLNINLENGDRLDSVKSPSKNSENECLFQRGRENWLSRFKRIDDENINSEIIQEVKALFSKWLRMQNLNILIGAGASFYVTDFLCSGLFEAVKKLLQTSQSRSTLEKILHHSSNPNKIGENFESLLSQLTAFRQLSKNDDWPLDKFLLDIPLQGTRGREKRRKLLSELLLDIERSIVVACNVELPPSQLSSPQSKNEKWHTTPHEAVLAKLISRNPQQGRARIFTLNYDTLLEQAMDRLGILYSDGFSGTVARRFNPSIYNLDSYYPGEITEGKVRRYDKVLQLYKLHGSINWRRTSDSWPGNPYGIEYDQSILPKSEDIFEGKENLENVFSKNQSLAILPTSGKYGETLGMPFAHMFRAFGQSLQLPQTALMVIGYGGWDLHLNRLIEDALTNPNFTCIFIDPYPSEWTKRLCRSDYCGRVYYLGGYWGSFEYFTLNVLPDLEVLKTELDIAKTISELQGFQKSKEMGSERVKGEE